MLILSFASQTAARVVSHTRQNYPLWNTLFCMVEILTVMEDQQMLSIGSREGRLHIIAICFLSVVVAGGGRLLEYSLGYTFILYVIQCSGKLWLRVAALLFPLSICPSCRFAVSVVLD